jgi:hypothetical protein
VPGYNEYTNPLFGFTTLWPSSFSALPPATTGGGQEWASQYGQVVLNAYGDNNVFHYSPAQDEAADMTGLSVVSYQHMSGNVVTVSGLKNDMRTIVYQVDIVGPGSIDTLYWTYPTSEKKQWDAAVTLTARAFRPGDVDVSH